MKEISSSQGMKKKPWYVYTVLFELQNSKAAHEIILFSCCSVLLFVDPIVIYYRALGEREQQQATANRGELYVVVVTLAQRLVHSPKEGFSR